MSDQAAALPHSALRTPHSALLAVLVVVLCCAWLTDLIGIHAVFGAFVAGVAMPRGQLLTMIHTRTEPLVSGLLLPAFFVFAGLQTDLGLLLVPAALLVAAVVLVLSFGGKFGAVALAARYQGMSWHEAGALGAFANARGLTELVLLTVGLTHGIITASLYTVLAVMAFATTLATTPLFRLFERRAHARGLEFGPDGEAESAPRDGGERGRPAGPDRKSAPVEKMPTAR